MGLSTGGALLAYAALPATTLALLADMTAVLTSKRAFLIRALLLTSHIKAAQQLLASQSVIQRPKSRLRS